MMEMTAANWEYKMPNMTDDITDEERGKNLTLEWVES